MARLYRVQGYGWNFGCHFFFWIWMKSEPKVRSFLHYFYDILLPLRRTLRTTPRSLPNHEGYYSFKNMVMNIKYILRGRIFLTRERSMPPPMSQSNEPFAMERRWGFNSMWQKQNIVRAPWLSTWRAQSKSHHRKSHDSNLALGSPRDPSTRNKKKPMLANALLKVRANGLVPLCDTEDHLTNTGLRGNMRYIQKWLAREQLDGIWQSVDHVKLTVLANTICLGEELAHRLLHKLENKDFDAAFVNEKIDVLYRDDNAVTVMLFWYEPTSIKDSKVTLKKCSARWLRSLLFEPRGKIWNFRITCWTLDSKDGNGELQVYNPKI